MYVLWDCSCLYVFAVDSCAFVWVCCLICMSLHWNRMELVALYIYIYIYIYICASGDSTVICMDL